MSYVYYWTLKKTFPKIKCKKNNFFCNNTVEVLVTVIPNSNAVISYFDFKSSPSLWFGHTNLDVRDTYKSHTGIRTANPTLTHCNNNHQRRRELLPFPCSEIDALGLGFFRSAKFSAQWRRNQKAPSPPPPPPTSRCWIRSARSFTVTIPRPLRIRIPKKPSLRPLRIRFSAFSAGRGPFIPFWAPENVKLCSFHSLSYFGRRFIAF